MSALVPLEALLAGMRSCSSSCSPELVLSRSSSAVKSEDCSSLGLALAAPERERLDLLGRPLPVPIS